MARQKAELSVIMKAKDLCGYIMDVTQKSPKQYRFTFTTRLQNMSMDIITDLYRANDIFVEGKDARNKYMKRLELQREAISKVRILAYISQLALEQKAILPKQYQQISLLSTEVLNLVGGWMKSDRERYIRENS